MPEAAGSDTLTIFSINSKSPSFSNWKRQGTFKTAYDHEIKGYTLVGGLSSKLSAPQSDRQQSLGFSFPFILLQCKIIDKRGFDLNIFYTSTDNVKRRITLNGLKPYSYSLDNIIR